MVTVAVRRVPLDRSTESFLDYLSPSLQILPNTAGCYTAEDAVRTARLAREALQTDLVKLEVIGDQTTLFPDNEQTLEAARVLVKEGFVVLPYFNDDLIMAKKLLDAGCAAIMPLAAPIGSGLGVQNPANLRIMREQLPDATMIVDAGVGTASDAAIAMELGADGVLIDEPDDLAGFAERLRLFFDPDWRARIGGRACWSSGSDRSISCQTCASTLPCRWRSSALPVTRPARASRARACETDGRSAPMIWPSSRCVSGRQRWMPLGSTRPQRRAKCHRTSTSRTSSRGCDAMARSTSRRRARASGSPSFFADPPRVDAELMASKVAR